MRFKLALTVHAQVGESAKSVVVQQRIPVEYKVQFQMCPECNREYTNRTWHAVVQLRQRGASSTRKGLLFLEMYIAKHAELQRDVLSVQTTKNGFDFYFLQLVSAQAFASDLSKIYPMKLKTTSKMVSEDVKNNTKNMKHTLLCDLVPFSKDDLVLWDLEEGGNSSGRPSSHVKLCLVLKMAGSIHFVDAAPTGDLSMDKALMVLSPERFWKLEKQFHVMGSSRRLTRFIVLDVEWTTDISSMGHSKERVSTFLPGDVEEESPKLYTGPSSGMDKYRLAYVQVAREADMGVTDEIFHCTTHLGNLLQAGDVVVGYDMVNSVMTGAEEWMTHAIMQSNNHSIPDVVLVKKVSGVTSPMDESGKNMNKKSKTSPRKSRKGRNRKSHDVVKDDPVDEEISSWDEQSDDEEPPESGVEEDGLELSSK
jgi:nonsense-mediated mRNA decay protein 3